MYNYFINTIAYAYTKMYVYRLFALLNDAALIATLIADAVAPPAAH